MKRLRELRENRGLTLDQVAAALNLRNQYVSNYELGKRKPDYETLKRFADFYNVTVDYLLERENKISQDQEYFRIMSKAKKDGFSASDIEKALDFLKYAKERDKNNK